MLVKFTAGSDDDEDTDDDEDNDEDNDEDKDDDDDDDDDEGGTGEMTVGFSPPRRVAGWR